MKTYRPTWLVREFPAAHHDYRRVTLVLPKVRNHMNPAGGCCHLITLPSLLGSLATGWRGCLIRSIHPSSHPFPLIFIIFFINCPYQKEMTCGCPIHIVGLGCRYPPLKNLGLTLEIHTFVRDRRRLYSISCHAQRMVSSKIFHCRVIVPKWTM